LRILPEWRFSDINWQKESQLRLVDIEITQRMSVPEEDGQEDWTVDVGKFKKEVTVTSAADEPPDAFMKYRAVARIHLAETDGYSRLRYWSTRIW
jgi:hypothetical protein